jgi:serine/threonine protein kinase
LVETGHSVGEYKLITRLNTIQGTVIQATDGQSKPVAIKVIDKCKVCTPGELEGVYREFRFLNEILKHPNVNHCVKMLHSERRVYLVFEFAGNQNVREVISDRPGERFDEEEALQCFRQVGEGLSYCHSKEISHRNLSLEHVVTDPVPGGHGYHCRIVDFRSALLSRGETQSRTICGTLPYIAPEMAMGGPYIAWRSDCWSAGIVLLEMGGGIGSLFRSVGLNPDSESADVAQSIQQYFAAPGSQATALATIGAIKRKDIVLKLHALLQPVADDRQQLSDVLLLE